MYEAFFGMEHTPFVRDVPPEKLYESSAFRETLGRLSYVADRQMFAVVTADSGCGKSTLLKLLMRFYETDSGSVSYGTRNVNEIDTGHLRNHISYVTQETFLFQDTIENNIKVAKADATREEVIEFMILSIPCHRGMTQSLGNSEIRYQEENARESELRGHFFMMPRLFCWMSLQAILTA